MPPDPEHWGLEGSIPVTAAGAEDASIDCVDLVEGTLERGRALADECGQAPDPHEEESMSHSASIFPMHSPQTPWLS